MRRLQVERDRTYRQWSTKELNLLSVVQVGRSDLLGGRFNGYSVGQLLSERGINSTHLVHDKRSSDDGVKEIFAGPRARRFISTATQLERRLGYHAMLQLNSFGLPV